MQVPDLNAQRRSMGGPMMRIVSSDGQYLGNTRLPVMNGSISNGIVAGLLENAETGEQILTVFRIVSAHTGLSYP